MLKARDILDKSIQEIEALIEDARKELFAILNHAELQKKHEKPHLKKEKRKEIARMLTVLRNKKLEAEAHS